jgi:hypothetical protein
MNTADFLYFSEDQRLMVVNELVLYEYTHTNEDGARQYRIVGVTSVSDEAEYFLAGKPAKYRRVKQDREVDA